MEEKSGYRSFAWVCLIVTVLALCGVIIIWRTCNRLCLLQLGSPEPKGEIVIENSELASWMTISNRVKAAGPYPELRYGVLIQAGVFKSDEGSTFQCKEIALIKTDGTEETYSCTQGETKFPWVNVFAGPSTASPIEPELAKSLAPVGPDATCCGTLPKCLPSSPGVSCNSWPTSCNSSLAPRCLRARKLHSDLQVEAMLTYWRGDGGYRLKTEQVVEQIGSPTNPKEVTLDKYTFLLDDAFQVQVYTCDEPSPGQPCNWSAPTTIPQVETIVFRSEKVTEPETGLHKDPPWPPTKP